MEKICGVRLLIPTIEAFDACPNVFRLTLPAAMAWGLLKQDKPLDDIRKVFSILTKKPEADVCVMVENLLSSFVDAGVLIMEDEV